MNAFDFSDRWRMSLNNQDFIIIDHYNPRYIPFGITKSLLDLCVADHLFMDGTFKVCPSPFGPLYAIHIESPVANGTIPVFLFFFYPTKPNQFMHCCLMNYELLFLSMI